MADTVVTVTIPEAVADRVIAAFTTRYANATISQVLAALVKDVAKSYEMEVAATDARASAASTADTDFSGIQ